jgi:hypothetical protein
MTAACEDEKARPVDAPEKEKKAPKKKQADPAENSDKAASPEKKRKTPRSESKKRGPARPLRRVPREILDSRIEKLEKRLKRTTSQMEDASRHYAAYTREREFRKAEGDTEETAASTTESAQSS